jgi:Rrf2 family nitric oxide-sensitive transcriptional repressor
VRHLEATTPLVDCFKPGGGTCTLRPGCRLKGRLLRAREMFLEELNTANLDDIAYPFSMP